MSRNGQARFSSELREGPLYTFEVGLRLLETAQVLLVAYVCLAHLQDHLHKNIEMVAVCMLTARRLLITADSHMDVEKVNNPRLGAPTPYPLDTIHPHEAKHDFNRGPCFH